MRQFLFLDHGFVRVIDYMGDDTDSTGTRVSYGKEQNKSQQTRFN